MGEKGIGLVDEARATGLDEVKGGVKMRQPIPIYQGFGSRIHGLRMALIVPLYPGELTDREEQAKDGIVLDDVEVQEEEFYKNREV